MTEAEIGALNKARASLARRRNAVAESIGGTDLAPAKAAESLTHILMAIEAVDRALADAGRPYLFDPAEAISPTKPQERVEQGGAQTSAARAKARIKAAVEMDRERQPSPKSRRGSSS